MPVTKLYVEGYLDEDLLAPLMAGRLAVKRVGSKHNLPHDVRHDRNEVVPLMSCYLRDRDFDHEPPVAVARLTPTPDRRENNGGVLGYRWARHCIENYVLDAQFAQAVAMIDPAEWNTELERAAGVLRDHEAGRYTIAQIREEFYRRSFLHTRPSRPRGEYELPTSLSETDTWAWLLAETSEFASTVSSLTAVGDLRQRFDHFRNRLPVAPAEEVLHWYSGKDLLAALAPYLRHKGIHQPYAYVDRVTVWVQNNRDEPRAFFPEWQALFDALTT